MMEQCTRCFWNFDGVCASHSPEDPDTYGTPITETVTRYPDGCPEFRLTLEDWQQQQALNEQEPS